MGTASCVSNLLMEIPVNESDLVVVEQIDIVLERLDECELGALLVDEVEADLLAVVGHLRLEVLAAGELGGGIEATLGGLVAQIDRLAVHLKMDLGSVFQRHGLLPQHGDAAAGLQVARHAGRVQVRRVGHEDDLGNTNNSGAHAHT